MAPLTARTRANLPKKTFGLPGQGKYPMPDASHAANAKARATQQFNKGNLSTSGRAQVNAKANRVLGKKGNASSDRRAMAEQMVGNQQPKGRKLMPKARFGGNK